MSENDTEPEAEYRTLSEERALEELVDQYKQLIERENELLKEKLGRWDK